MNQQQEDMDQHQQKERMPQATRGISKDQILLTLGSLATSGVVDVCVHNSFITFMTTFAALGIAVNSNKILDAFIPGREAMRIKEATHALLDAVDPVCEFDYMHQDQSAMAKIKRLLGLKTFPPGQPKTDVPRVGQNELGPLPSRTAPLAASGNPFAMRDQRSAQSLIPRLTMRQIVEHTKRNSYEVYIGRSLTVPGSSAVKINFYNRHIKLIGASQHGKSSMAAALLEAIIRTHDEQKVMIALLDKDDKTGRLFADVPHLGELQTSSGPVLLHARNELEVLEKLEWIVKLMDYRYSLSEQAVDEQPLLIVYIEEFIDLKDFFKNRMNMSSGDEKEQATRDYQRLVLCIKKISRLGLKAHVQLLMCAQVDYRDEGLQEALVNITSGMAFCVRLSAAQAAGFLRTDLLKKNAQDDQIGQAVVEMPDCKDLILAPEYPLKARLKELPPAETKPLSMQEQDMWAASAPMLQDCTNETEGEQVAGPLPMDEDLREALEAYQQGAKGPRAMERALGCTYYQAQKLWAELVEKGLVETD